MILDDMVATRNEKNLLCGWNNVKKDFTVCLIQNVVWCIYRKISSNFWIEIIFLWDELDLQKSPNVVGTSAKDEI